jgi:hypothetical protein
VVFDATGGVRYMQESAPTGDKKFTTATMYLVPFETITSFGPALPQFNEEPGACLGACLPSHLCSFWSRAHPSSTHQKKTQPSSSVSTR